MIFLCGIYGPFFLTNRVTKMKGLPLSSFLVSFLDTNSHISSCYQNEGTPSYPSGKRCGFLCACFGFEPAPFLAGGPCCLGRDFHLSLGASLNSPKVYSLTRGVGHSILSWVKKKRKKKVIFHDYTSLLILRI